MSTATRTSVSPGKWRLIREAITGTQQNFTEGSLTRAIALLAIPTALEMAMESTFAIVDALWLARLGKDAMAVVGLTEALVVLIFGIGLGLSMAATATVSRRIGEKKPDAASIAAVQAIGCGVVISALSGVLGALFAPQLLGLMHASPEVIRGGVGFTRILLGGNATIVLLFLINGIFRGSGDAVMSMRTLMLANAVNMVLDPCLIYGLGPFPQLGVEGAAVATTTGRGIGVLYQLYELAAGRRRIAVARRHLRLDWPVLRRLLRVSSIAMLQYMVSTASWVSLARINAGFGSAAVAGYTLALRIVLFALQPSWGICNAAATLVGQNLGAKRPDRSERAVWLAGTYNTIFLTCVAVVFWTFGPVMVRVFSSDAHVAAIATECLRYIALGYPFYAWGMTMEQAFNGAGDTATPTYINLFCYWLLQVPFAWWMANEAGFGPRGVYLAICGAESLLAVISVIVFRRGNWKRARV